ncbi:hypothetical protein GCM10010269_30910 [Streptomyces humidus]|uniref:IS110 family transposase n=1 Tax=Streptomyces humidus TaxID=52259 RepID=A0A918L3P7_9ACTN|nr:hypothetical protein GCM10010269_30910 [Streptomyces humidus]
MVVDGGVDVVEAHGAAGGAAGLAAAFGCMNANSASRTYYDHQRARGKTHTQALLRLARQRISVLFAMLRDGTFYESRTPKGVELAA